MTSLEKDLYSNIKIYREIFKKVNESLINLFKTVRPVCNRCKSNCEVNIDNPIQKFPENCNLKYWKDKILNLINYELSKEVIDKTREITKRRTCYECNRCTVCCRLACCEYDYQALKERAKNGDKFSQQFISVFIPYDKKAEVREIFPDYIKLLEKKIPELKGVYFYYCPKLDNKTGLCSDYENRPDICRDFPNNPLSILPETCGFKSWKDDVEIESFMLHALIEIMSFYKDKLEKINDQEK